MESAGEDEEERSYGVTGVTWVFLKPAQRGDGVGKSGGEITGSPLRHPLSLSPAPALLEAWVLRDFGGIPAGSV